MSFFSFSGYSQLALEGFETPTGVTGSLPATWTLGTGNWSVFENNSPSTVGTFQSWGFNAFASTIPYQGSNCASVNREFLGPGLSSEDYLSTPLVTIPSNGELHFYSRIFYPVLNQGMSYQIKVAPSTASPTNPSAYIMVQQWDDTAFTTSYAEKVISLSAYAGQQVYVAFVRVYNQPTTVTSIDGDRWLIDNVSIVQQCLDPTGLAANGITQTSANLTWGNPSGATSWEIEVIPATGTPTGIGTVYNGTLPYAVTVTTAGTAFTPSTAYKYYVRALCGSGASSLWVGPFPFSTSTPGLSCAAPIVVTSLPYSTTDNTANYSDNTAIEASPGASGCGSTNNYLNGNDVVYSYTATTTGVINVSMTPTATYSGIFVYNSCANIGVSCIAGIANSGTNVRAFDLPVTAGTTYYFVISTWATPQTTAYTLTIQVVNCPPPTTLSASNMTLTSAQLSWANPGGASSWEVAVQTAGSAIPSGSGDLAGTNTNFPVSGLTANTAYQYYVRASCGNGTFSAWAGPFIFSTTPGLSCSFPITIGTLPYSTTDDTSNYSDNPAIEGSPGASGCGSTNSYLNGNDVVYSYTASTTGVINVSMTPTATYSGIFVYNSCANIGVSCIAGIANSGTNVRAFDLPVTAGTTYYFVISTWATPQTTAYTLTIQVVNCPPPTTLSASNMTLTSAQLSWANPGGASSWEVAVQTAGSAIPSGSGDLAGTNTNFLVSGLTTGTAYQYYVRADCGNGTFSAWSGPFPFSTTICAPVNQCNYTFTMTDSFSDGWNGGIMQVRQNGIVVATLTGPATGSATVSVALCDGVPFDLYWSKAGSFPDEIGVSIKEALAPQQTIFTYAAGTGTPLTVLYSDIAICTPPTCPRPTLVSFTNHTQTGATISWIDTSSATQWQILALPCGSPAPTASSTGYIDTTTNPHPLTGLIPLTCYNVYVRAVCSSSDISFWSVPTQLIQLPPNCVVNPAASDTCVNAPSICNLNGYCGNTSAAYTSTSNWNQLTTEFCGVDDNDSFITFVASASTVSLNVWVTSSQNGDGIQIMIFGAATCGSGPVTSYSCYDQIPANATAYPITATGLTPGNTYYALIDGYAGDVCDYIIAVPNNGGISTQVAVTTTNTNLCTSGQATLNAAGGNGVYNWTVSPTSSVLSATTGSSVTFTPTIAGTYTITATSTDGNLSCPQALVDFKTIVVTDAVNATIAYGASSYCTSIAAVQPVTITGATGGTFSAIPTSGLSIDATTGTINPSLSTSGSYQVYYTILANGGCPDFTTSTIVEIIATPNIVQSSAVLACDSYTLLPLSVGNYFTQSQLGGGTTTPLDINVPLTTNQTLYVYANNNGCTNEKSFTVTINASPIPILNVIQPTCAIPTGTIEVTSPLNGSGSGLPANLFISEVTDAANGLGALTYVEIYNGTGSSVDLSNYKLNTYNNGSATVNSSCDNTLSGIINNNSTVVVAIGSASNQGGITPNLVFSGCTGINDNDNIRLTKVDTGQDIDLWGDTADVSFTPLGQAGYTYRRLPTATVPSLSWNPADWVIIDDAATVVDYSNIGQHTLSANNYEYSLDNGTYQSGTTFAGVAPGNHTITVHDLVTGCYSNPEPVTINSITLTPTELGFSYTSPVCINSTTNPTPITNSGFTNGGEFSATPAGLSIDASSGLINITNSEPGAYTVSYFVNPNNSICLAGGTSTALITVKSMVTLGTNISYASPFCFGGSNPLPNTSSNGFTSGGIYSSTTAISLNPNTGEIDLVNSSAGSHPITYTVVANAANCELTTPSTTTVVITAPVQINVDSGCQSNNYTLTALPLDNSFDPETATYTWSNGSGQVVGTNAQSITVTETGSYTVTVTSNGCSSVSLPVSVDSINCVIQKGISVNNDGKNDTFDLSGFNVKKLTIFNRYGLKVYDKNDYINEWGGQSSSGDELPDGTYYYVIARDNGQNKSGWIYINRAQ